MSASLKLRRAKALGSLPTIKEACGSSSGPPDFSTVDLSFSILFMPSSDIECNDATPSSPSTSDASLCPRSALKRELLESRSRTPVRAPPTFMLDGDEHSPPAQRPRADVTLEQDTNSAASPFSLPIMIHTELENLPCPLASSAPSSSWQIARAAPCAVHLTKQRRAESFEAITMPVDIPGSQQDTHSGSTLERQLLQMLMPNNTAATHVEKHAFAVHDVPASAGDAELCHGKRMDASTGNRHVTWTSSVQSPMTTRRATRTSA